MAYILLVSADYGCAADYGYAPVVVAKKCGNQLLSQ